MIIVANSPSDKEVAMRFLNAHGVNVAMTDDFNAFGRLGADNKLLGVVAFNSFNGKTCAMHVAGDGNWLSKDLIRASFHYPFVTCGVRHIVATISGSNLKSIRFTKHMGFEVLFRLPCGWSNTEDMVVLGMPHNKCRWLAQEQDNELKVA